MAKSNTTMYLMLAAAAVAAYFLLQNSGPTLAQGPQPGGGLQAVMNYFGYDSTQAQQWITKTGYK